MVYFPQLQVQSPQIISSPKSSLLFQAFQVEWVCHGKPTLKQATSLLCISNCPLVLRPVMCICCYFILSTCMLVMIIPCKNVLIGYESFQVKLTKKITTLADFSKAWYTHRCGQLSNHNNFQFIFFLYLLSYQSHYLMKRLLLCKINISIQSCNLCDVLLYDMLHGGM